MKKILALALALVMIFCLAACGENKKDDDGTTVPTTTAPNTPNVPGFSAGTKVGMSVADLDALLQPLLNGDAGTDVEDLYIEMGASDTNVLLALGAKLLGENIDANLFIGDGLVFSAPALLDKNYGVKAEDMADFVEGFMNGFMGGVMGDAGMGTLMPTVPSIDPQAAMDLVGKYYTMLIDEIKTADGITATEEDGGVVITGTLDSDAVAVIVIDIIEAACADDDFFELMGIMQGVDPDEFKQAFLQSKPSKEDLLTQMKAMLAAYEVEVQIENLCLADNIPVIADLTVSLNQDVEGGNRPAVIDVAYDLINMTCDFSFLDEGTEIFGLVMGDGEMEMVVNMGGVNMEAKITTTDTGMTGYVKQNGVELVSFSFAITENGFRASMTSNGETMSVELAVTDSSITLSLNMRGSVMEIKAEVTENTAEGTLTMDGQEMGKIVFVKKVEGSKISYTLTTLSVQGTEIDFSEGGLSFYIDTNAEISAAPDYIDITTLDNDELQAVLEKFATDNADLVEMISGLFGSMGGSNESGDRVEVDYYAA